MPKKRSPRPRPAAQSRSSTARSRPRASSSAYTAAALTAAGRTGTVTVERATRLYRLLQLLGTGPQTRDTLTQKLNLDVRGFYRDLELLRSVGILVTLQEYGYALCGQVERAVASLPFPDPHLTLGEAIQLAKGRTRAHRKLNTQITQILP